MTSSIYCSPEKLVNNLNDIFNEVPLDKQFTMAYLSIYLREKAKNANEESIQNSLNLLADLCSPILNFDSPNSPFFPLSVYGDNRSFMPYDLNDGQLDYMKSILNVIIQPQLKARYFQHNIYKFWHRAAVLAKQTKQNFLTDKITEKLLNELKNSSIEKPKKL